MARRRSTTTKDKLFAVRLSAEEYERLRQVASRLGRSVGYVLRAAAAETPMPPPPPSMASWDLQSVRELRRIGTNLNQIIRELYRHDRQAITIQEIAVLDTQLMRLIAMVYLGDQAAQRLLAERFSIWFTSVNIPNDPTAPNP